MPGQAGQDKRLFTVFACRFHTGRRQNHKSPERGCGQQPFFPCHNGGGSFMGWEFPVRILQKTGCWQQRRHPEEYNGTVMFFAMLMKDGRQGRRGRADYLRQDKNCMIRVHKKKKEVEK